DEEFRELDERLKAMPMFDQDAVRLLRFFSADAIDASADAQGRVAIPYHLREFAGIEREVTIVGTGNRLEIWSKQRWDEFTHSMNEELIRESAKALGIG
ncbi:MAG: division/cell wall cluster transcriptional repressor MraZ, partial [Armatimonadota bacterium]